MNNSHFESKASLTATIFLNTSLSIPPEMLFYSPYCTHNQKRGVHDVFEVPIHLYFCLTYKSWESKHQVLAFHAFSEKQINRPWSKPKDLYVQGGPYHLACREGSLLLVQSLQCLAPCSAFHTASEFQQQEKSCCSLSWGSRNGFKPGPGESPSWVSTLTSCHSYTNEHPNIAHSKRTAWCLPEESTRYLEGGERGPHLAVLARR